MRIFTFLMLFFATVSVSAQQLSIAQMLELYRNDYDQQVLLLKKHNYDVGQRVEDGSEFVSANFLHQESSDLATYKIGLNYQSDTLSLITQDVAVCDGSPRQNIEDYQSELVSLGFSLERSILSDHSKMHQMYIYKKRDYIITVSSLISKDRVRCSDRSSSVVIMLSEGPMGF